MGEVTLAGAQGSRTASAEIDQAPELLALRAIERRWGPRKVLDGATLTVSRGTVAWLGGPNGAGKTTLLRIAAGVLIPNAGTVSLDELDPERDRRRYQRLLGFLSAGDRGLYARLTVRQNLEFWFGLALLPASDRERLIEASIVRFELEELSDRRVDRLSMGQRQRVRLALTFLHQPELVLLDEPHTSLDDSGLRLLEAAFEELTNRGGSVLWCSPAERNLPLRADVRHHLAQGRVVG